jgi:hypothetical protein
MQTTHIVYKFQQVHKKLIYYNYVAVNRVVADLTKPMDETDTNEVIVTATDHEHAGRLRTLQLSEVRDRWRPLSKTRTSASRPRHGRAVVPACYGSGLLCWKPAAGARV